jgi:hypothetical protein
MPPLAMGAPAARQRRKENGQSLGVVLAAAVRGPRYTFLSSGFAKCLRSIPAKSTASSGVSVTA